MCFLLRSFKVLISTKWILFIREDWAFRRGNLLLFICSPLKLSSFAPSVPGPGNLEWPRGTTKNTKSRLSAPQKGCLDVICSKLWIQANHLYITCFWSGLLYSPCQLAAFSDHELFKVVSWRSNLLHSVPIFGGTLGLMLEFSLAPRSECILLTLLWQKLVSGMKRSFLQPLYSILHRASDRLCVLILGKDIRVNLWNPSDLQEEKSPPSPGTLGKAPPS